MPMNTEIDSAGDLRETYRNLVELWTSGVRDYHTLLSDYFTANSVFVAAIGFLLVREPLSAIFLLLIVILCGFGILMALQMAIVLGRFSAQTALWEWRLRGIEHTAIWTQQRLFVDLQRLRDRHQALEDADNEPPVMAPNWATRRHRQWWARREISFPLFFGIVYTLFLAWGVTQIFAGS
ncbi:MAG TPA: hypothetical protein VFN94_02585 [Nitrospiria bacterium]|nr:hypothetical protein [Nitrospiria bacterium]